MSRLEEKLLYYMQAHKLPLPVREHRFKPGRRWRFDFAWPDIKLAVEVEGTTSYGKNKNGTMKLGRHQTATGVAADCEKYNEAVLLGWAVLRFTQKQINSGNAVEVIRRQLEKVGVIKV